MNIWKEMQKDYRSFIRQIKEEPWKRRLFIVYLIIIAELIGLYFKK
jgi:hypothetical protein